jgi:hypothetical protein
LISFRGLAVDDLLIVDRCGVLIRRLGVGSKISGVSTWGPVWSHDGATIYFAATGAVMKVPATGGTAVAVVQTLGMVARLDVSRDGTKLVYDESAHLVVLDLGTMQTTDLTILGDEPRFSPDGTKLVYIFGSKVRTIDLGTMAVTDVFTLDSGAFGSAAWFSDGQGLAVSNANGIDLLTLDGSGNVVGRVTPVNQAALRDVDVARDDSAIAFGVNFSHSIYILNMFSRAPAGDGGLAPDAMGADVPLND